MKSSTLSMSAARSAAFLCALLTAGCAVFERAPEREFPQASAAPAATVAISPSVAPSVEPKVEPKVEPRVAPSVAPPAPPTVRRAAGQAEAKPPTLAPPPAAQAPKTAAPAPALAKPQAPPLDLKSLESGLRQTKAIGVLTKLTLKNQVDDLLDRFRAFYKGQFQTTLAELRRSFDLLVLKVLALLQDADPPLAAAIVASRESLWSILLDPAKLETV